MHELDICFNWFTPYPLKLTLVRFFVSVIKEFSPERDTIESLWFINTSKSGGRKNNERLFRGPPFGYFDRSDTLYNIQEAKLFCSELFRFSDKCCCFLPFHCNRCKLFGKLLYIYRNPKSITCKSIIKIHSTTLTEIARHQNFAPSNNRDLISFLFPSLTEKAIKYKVPSNAPKRI